MPTTTTPPTPPERTLAPPVRRPGGSFRWSRWYKDTRRLGLLHMMRWAERRLSTRSLYWMVRAHAFGRAVWRGVPPAVGLPACLRAADSPPAIREWRGQGYVNQVLEFLPERLTEPRWLNRCRIQGLDRLRQARQSGRPVVLAFFHFGAYRLARFWLRAAGIPVATLIGGNAEKRPRADRLSDAIGPFPEVPTAFYQDQLRSVNAFLAAGNSLLIAIDSAAGKQMDVPVGADWSFQMATGAVRLAMRHGAELIPCAVIDAGRWRYQIILGRPVPAEYLAVKDEYLRAGKHLLEEVLPLFRTHPALCSDHLIQRFRRLPTATPEGEPAE